MKKALLSIVVAGVMLSAIGTSAMAAGSGRGGAMGLIAGCCFGIRASGDYNSGKDIHWREWLSLIFVGSIWNGLDGYSGVTTEDYVAKYGAQYY